MSGYKHPELEENFLREPSKIDDLIRFLDEIMNANKMDKKKDKNDALIDYSADVTDDNFMVTERIKPSANATRKASLKKIVVTGNLNQMTFMRQIDVTDAQRIAARSERCRVANNYRKLGNAEFRKGIFDKAASLYTQGLQYIPDTPVLYVNRALCYIKKGEFKRAIVDLDFVIMNLDSRNVRAWLYRAGALLRMHDEVGCDESIANARRFNREEVKYIEYFLSKMKSDL